MRFILNKEIQCGTIFISEVNFRSLRDQVNDLKEQLKYKECEKEELSSELEHEKQIYKILQDQLEKMGHVLSDEGLEASSLKQRVLQLTMTLSEMENQKRYLAQTLEDTNRKHDLIMNEAKELKDKLQDYDETNKVMRNVSKKLRDLVNSNSDKVCNRM